jgi:hypothetical protein
MAAGATMTSKAMQEEARQTDVPLRILLLCHSFNGLTQRLFVMLRERGHHVSVEFDIADSVTEEAVALFQPDLIVAPFLRRRIPQSVWSRLVCLVLHPGVVGDRGPAALDRAMLRGELDWGVTLLQANDEFDAGPVWASHGFAMRAAAKSSIYRHEVSRSAVRALVDGAWRNGVANLGKRPTFGKLQENFEVHLFDFAGDLYGKVLRVALVDFIRPEMKFAGLDALKAQIAADGQAARTLLGPLADNRGDRV